MYFHRLDTTLIDFTDMKCQRGDLSFIFNGDAAPSESFVVLDNEQKVYQRIHHEVRVCVSTGCAVPQPFTSNQNSEFTKQGVPLRKTQTPKKCKLNFCSADTSL